MKIENVTEAYEEYQVNVENTLTKLKGLFRDEEKLWDEIKSLEVSFYKESKLISFLADSLQMANEENRVKEIDLEKVKSIYELLIRFYPDNLSYYIDLIALVNNVLDDELYAQSLIQKVNEKIAQAQKAVNEIINSNLG